MISNRLINTITESVIQNIKEAHYRNVGDEIELFTGRRPKTIKARINQIYKLANKYGLSSRLYHDDHWQALRDYDTVISSMGCELTYWCENGGYTDYSEFTGMNMSKVYNIEISYDDGMVISGYIKMMAAGSNEDPFDAYDTCMVLWPKSSIRETKLDKKLHQLVKESINEVFNPQKANYQLNVGQQVGGSHAMQRSIDNGGREQWQDDFLAQQDSYYGKIAKLAQQHNTTYPKLLADLQTKINYYLQSGYFGENQEVLTVIKQFTELLAYMNGAYEAAVSRLMNKTQQPAIVAEGLRDYLRGLMYKNANSYGVQQKIKDKSGNQYAINQRNGQWMSDLQAELQQLLQWNFLHGKKTIIATQAFIQFLNVEKRALFAWFDKNAQRSLNTMKKALIGVTMLATVGIGVSSSMNGNGGYQQQPQQAQTQQVMNQQQRQTITVGCQRNQSTLSQQDVQQLQQLPPGSYMIVVHQLTNPSGKDASYEMQLCNNRGNAVSKYIMNNGGKVVKVQRGNNVDGRLTGDQAQIDIIRVN